MENDITICAKCTHFIENGNIWYDQFCGSDETKRILTVNPVSGKKEYAAKNDFSGDYFTDNPHQYARDMNDGNCQYFKKKEFLFTPTGGN